ncbi:cysteine desulfurase NifS [Sesbania bispinosa]|nr:cysteine desulfurase NifS [Sesbania bispinosa]
MGYVEARFAVSAEGLGFRLRRLGDPVTKSSLSSSQSFSPPHFHLAILQPNLRVEPAVGYSEVRFMVAVEELGL